MATPNSEQILAIEHNGGVLLKAGAGSGKTFVLKEHIIYLIKNWIKEFEKQSDLEFENFIRAKLRRVVVMTFTKKAAGELEIRVQNQVSEYAQGEEDKEYWGKVKENINYLTISTIHGFCLKLIKQGFFPGVSADQEILEDSRFKDIILQEFNAWLADESNKSLDIYPIILKEKKNVFQAILSIFSDPTLRISWEDTHRSEITLARTDEVIAELLQALNLTEIWETGINLDMYSDFSQKKWYPALQSFLEEKSSWKKDLNGLCEAFEYFQKINFKIPVKPSIKTVPGELVDFYEKFKDLKDYLKKEGESFFHFRDEFQTTVVPWFGMIKDLITYVSKKYDSESGVTFSDLEYIVYRGLASPKVIDQISEQYDYFIVDEFQDTSFIQFNIIEKIIKQDFSRLFCVGDLKQAIYGFRGGELGVFLHCEKVIPKALTLNNNYRSDSSIIDFNNKFFDFLFVKGMNFQGVDPGRVAVDHQTVPPEKKDVGIVKEVNVNLEFRTSEEKLANLEVDYIETLAILKLIQSYDKEEVCILYKRLKPSLLLIDLLIANGLGFTSQVKIPFLEDPILGMFDNLIEYGLNSSEEKDEYLLFQLKAYLSLLGSTRKASLTKENIEAFENNKKYYGLYNAFCTLLETWGIKTSNYVNNLAQIKALVNLAWEDEERLYNLLLSQRDLSYSLDFQFGENPERIKIMTAHASKGLQFKNVILGGMYTNENTVNFTSSIGKYPLSFKWTKDIHGKNRYKTPHYMLEDFLRKEKEFSESKRLFYVANTRAVSSLNYISINWGEHKRAKSQSSSWINGLYRWYEEAGKPDNLVEEVVDVKDLFSEGYLQLAELKPPLFHIDNLGTLPMEQAGDFVYLPELAITKFATVAECPKKFYLQNICKLSKEDLDSLNILDEQEQISFNFNADAKEDNRVKSSAERGTHIHEILATEIENGFNQSYLSLNQSIQRPVKWAVENLENYLDNYRMISENPIKFELLGYMVSGIPDLILSPLREVDELEIWDFKTGKSKEDAQNNYWFQLFSYAYAQYVLGHVKSEKPIKLVLLFVDEQKKLEKIVSKNKVENFLATVLENIKTPWIENTKACEKCIYKNICQK